MVESQRLAIGEFISNIKFGECEIHTSIPFDVISILFDVIHVTFAHRLAL